MDKNSQPTLHRSVCDRGPEEVNKASRQSSEGAAIDIGSKLLIVDGHAYAYRAFHAIRHLTSPSGAPTNAIYGFIKMLGKMRAQLAPSHAVVVWDGGLAAERMAEHPEYKTQRPPMPVGLEQQIDGITQYLQ